MTPRVVLLARSADLQYVTSWRRRAGGHATQLDEKMQACIKDCLACATVCEQTIVHCVRKGGKHAAPDHMQLLTTAPRCAS